MSLDLQFVTVCKASVSVCKTSVSCLRILLGKRRKGSGFTASDADGWSCHPNRPGVVRQRTLRRRREVLVHSAIEGVEDE